MKNYGNQKIIKLTQIAEFKAGAEIQGFYICREKHLKLTRNGDPYLDVTLSDTSGRIIGRLWENAQQFNEKFSSGCAVAVKGIPVEYNQILQLQIKLINEANPEIYARYGFIPEKLIPVISEDPQKLLKKISEILDNVSGSELKTLNKKILKKYAEKLSSLPASLNIHYTEKGGLLKHTCNCMLIGKRLSNIYSNINFDILITGLFLHDLGKIHCFDGEFIFEESDASRFNNHPELGWEIIMEEMKGIKKFPEILKYKLKHIIFNHHEMLVDDTPQAPCFPEAFLILHINKLDAGLNVMQRMIWEDPSDDDWTDAYNPFKRPLFKK